MPSIAKKLKMFLETLNHCDYCKNYLYESKRCMWHSDAAVSDPSDGCDGIGGGDRHKYELNFNAIVFQHEGSITSADYHFGDEKWKSLEISKEEWDNIK